MVHNVLLRPTLNADQSRFSWLALTLARFNFRLLVSKINRSYTGCNREATAAAISSMNTGRFLPLPMESGKCATGGLSCTPRASPVIVGNQKEQHIRPIGNKKC
jgi:hypothetical protein